MATSAGLWGFLILLVVIAPAVILSLLNLYFADVGDIFELSLLPWQVFSHIQCTLF